MKHKTISSVIIDVLKETKKGMSAKEIYLKIAEQNLYPFKASKPYYVVAGEIRKHCEGHEFPNSSKEKHFKLLPDGTYTLNNDERKKQE